MIALVPNSWGSDLQEMNTCHDKGTGQFCSKEYGSHKTLGKAVDAVLAAATARGVTLPRRVQIAAARGSRNTAMYSPSNDLLWVSPRVSAHLARVNPGYLVDPTLAGVINHELGHKLHAAAMGERYDNIVNTWMAPVLVERIKSEVSRYAATNGKEFVAEVYSGLAAGKTYGDEIMRFYRQLGGV